MTRLHYSSSSWYLSPRILAMFLLIVLPRPGGRLIALAWFVALIRWCCEYFSQSVTNEPKFYWTLLLHVLFLITFCSFPSRTFLIYLDHITWDFGAYRCDDRGWKFRGCIWRSHGILVTAVSLVARDKRKNLISFFARNKQTNSDYVTLNSVDFIVWRRWGKCIA
jgi:hypothetical protein